MVEAAKALSTSAAKRRDFYRLRQRPAEQAAVQQEQRDEHSDRERWAHDADLVHRCAEMIALRGDCSERNVGGLLRELFPAFAVCATTLRIDRLRAADCEHEQRAE